MAEVFNFFNQGWVGSLIGIIGIILGILGIFSYRFSKSMAKPAYQKSVLRLIGLNEQNFPQEVKVTYKGAEVNRLTKTTLTLWNNGTETLDGRNLIDSDPLCFSFNEGDKILNYKIIKKTKVANAFYLKSFKDSENKILFGFEYLDPKDGVVIELLHNSEKAYPIISGTIKGSPSGFVDQGIQLGNRKYRRNNSFFYKFFNTTSFYITTVIMGLTLIIFGLFPKEIKDFLTISIFQSSEEKNTSNGPIFFIILGVIYMILPAIMLWLQRRKCPKQLDITEIES